MNDDDLRLAIARAATVATSLRRALARLAPLLPIDGPAFLALAEEDRVWTDALLKRFENLVDVLQDQVFRLIAEAGQARDPVRLSRRDVLDYLEKVGVLPSADRFLNAARLRNRLSHVYPDDPAMQAGQVNRVQAAAGTALEALQRVQGWAAARGLIPIA